MNVKNLLHCHIFYSTSLCTYICPQQQTINMDLSHKEQICKIFQNSVSPFQRSYEFCGGFEMKCTQRRSGSCLSWEMSATIPKQDEDYYEFFLLQCPTKPKSSQNVTIPNYTAQCHVSTYSSTETNSLPSYVGLIMSTNSVQFGRLSSIIEFFQILLHNLYFRNGLTIIITSMSDYLS